MTNFEKWQTTMAELLKDAARSDRQVAEKLGLSASFVGKVRKKLEQEGKVQQSKRLGQDGRRRSTPRNLQVMRDRLLALLKSKWKGRKINEVLDGWVEKL